MTRESKDCHKAQDINQYWGVIKHRVMFDRNYQHSENVPSLSQLLASPEKHIYKAETLAERPTSCVPWEKFKRAMFIPDLIISLSMSTEREAGPAGSHSKGSIEEIA